jgi:DNA-binding NarL/FixJ family response regulator
MAKPTIIPDKMLTVAIVEDDERDRELLSRYIKRAQGLSLISAYATAEEAVKRFPHEKPKVVLMDIKLPGMDGIECIRRLRRIAPTLSIRFIVMTGHKDSNLIFDSLRAGAHGFLLKDKTSSKALLSAIKEVATGGGPMTPEVASQVIAYFEGKPNPRISLTDKEWSLLRDLTEGLSYKEIASQLSISLNTVRKRIRVIYDKLHVHSRKDAAKFAQDQQSARGGRVKA